MSAFILFATASSTVRAQHEGHSTQKPKPGQQQPASKDHAKDQKGDAHAGHQMPGRKADMKDEGHHSMPAMTGMDAMDHSSMNRAGMFLMGQSSGTGYQPAAWPMPMIMSKLGTWNLMWMGQAYLIATQQSGPKGGDKVYSSNWGMLGAVHRLGSGSFMLRTMLSLDPLTITGRRYPLLFQTGETAYGRPIVDGQHPHDFVMELSAQYSQRA